MIAHGDGWVRLEIDAADCTDFLAVLQALGALSVSSVSDRVSFNVANVEHTLVFQLATCATLANAWASSVSIWHSWQPHRSQTMTSGHFPHVPDCRRFQRPVPTVTDLLLE